MYKKVLIIVNPASGKNLAPKYGEKLAQVLSEAFAASVQIKETQGKDDAKHFAAQAQSEGYDTVVCLGGDGTVNETIQGLLTNEEKPRFAFIPFGTVNDLARALGYPLDPEAMIQQFHHMTLDHLDVAIVNDQIFVNVLALGDIPQSVMETSAEDKNNFGFFAYMKDAIGAALKQETMSLTIETGQGQSVDIETSILLVSLTNSVGGFEALVPHASYNDGLLHLAAVKGNHPLTYAKALFEGGIKEDSTDAILVISGDHFIIKDRQASVDKVYNANIDGDQGPSLPLDIRLLKGAIPVLVPEID